MNKKYQCGAIHASVFTNILLSAGIVGAVFFVLLSNTQETVPEQPIADNTPVEPPMTAPPLALSL